MKRPSLSIAGLFFLINKMSVVFLNEIPLIKYLSLYLTSKGRKLLDHFDRALDLAYKK
jgi:hypothetical protein